MGVMTMKIISSTSMTSTIGVTLMLELTFLPSSRLLIPIKVLSCPVVPAAMLRPACRFLPLTRATRAPPDAASLGGLRRPCYPSDPECAAARTPRLRDALPGELQVALLDEVVHPFAGAVV